MFDVNVVVLLLLVVPSGFGWHMQWEEYSEDGLPQMYGMEDFNECQRQQGSYCRIEVFMQADNESSAIAQEIQKSHNQNHRFARSVIFRMMCLPQDKVNDVQEVKKYVRATLGKELKDYNVTLHVPSYICTAVRRLSYFDYLIIAGLITYVWFLIKATRYHLRPPERISPYDEWLKMFSLAYNWNKAVTENKNADFQKLKSIQGLRFYLMVLVVACHTKLGLFNLFVENPKDLEQTMTSALFYKSIHIDMFIIQLFLMVSSMLLTNQIYELHKKNGSFTMWNCLNLYINRIVRFLPSLILVIFLGMLGIKLMPLGSIIMNQEKMILEGCEKHWLATILQTNYIHGHSKMCMPGTWYLSVDTFLYATTIILLYVQLKFKLNLTKVLLVAFAGMSLIFGCIIYTNDLDVMFRPTIKAMKQFLSSDKFRMLYLSPLSSWSTSVIGIAMGTIFYHTKNKKLELNWFQQMLWYMFILLLPVFVITFSLRDFRGFERPIVGLLLKPTFTLPFGVAILGMSKGYGGILKKIFEWDFAVTMSNFTFSTYLFHFFFTFGRGLFDRSLVTFQPINIIIFLFQDWVVSFISGMVATICFEMPGLSLQKMYVPQIKTIPKTEEEQKQK